MAHETWSRRGVRPQVKAASGGLVSCPFCPRTAEYAAVAAHLQTHQRSVVQYEEYDIYKCHLPCLKDGHYHCDMCLRAIVRKELFEKHLRKCSSSSRQHRAATPDAAIIMDPPSLETEVQTECTVVECPPSARRKTPERAACVHCHVVINKKNMKAHVRRKHCRPSPDVHAGHHLPSTCVDPKKGLFVVSRSFKGTVRPIHVQRCTRGGSDGMSKCQLDRCHQAQEVSRRRGLPGYECQHLKSTAFAVPAAAAAGDLCKEVLLQMAGERWVTSGMMDACLRRQQEAKAEGTPVSAVVSLEKDQDETYISVFEPRVTPHSKLGRVLVHYDQPAAAWNCPCVTSRKSCLHKSLAKWHLFQVRPELFRMEGLDDMEDAVAAESMVVVEEEVVDSGSAGDAPSYPPEGEELRGMLQYIIGHKAIPSDLPGYVSSAVPLVDVPKHLLPHETHCIKCAGRPPLSDPMVITTKATVVSFLGVVEDVTTYCKRCLACGSFYRYQEWTEGLHNFNDHLLLTLHLCIYLRNSAKNHTAVGRVLDALASTNNAKYPDHAAVLHAYLHFEALTSHDYSYCCVKCGHHPPVVVMDLHKKGVSGVPAADVEKPPPDFNGWVDCEDFWLFVAEEVLGQGFVSSSSANPFRISPSYHKWAPWIGRSTRRSDMLLNTEYVKGQAGGQDGSVGQEGLDVTAERLTEEVMDLKVEAVRRLAGSCGLDASGSKLQLVLRLREQMRSRATYDKVLEEVWAASGGWAVIMCPCAVVYAIKFNIRAESPRDFADLLLSFKHFPNIVVYDSVRDLVTHANNREPDVAPFRHFEGRLREATPANLLLLGVGTLDVNLPWLLSKLRPPEVNGHPSTGSAERYALCDSSHRSKARDPEDALRCIGLVPELRGRVSSQVAERFISKMRKNNYFMNTLSPGSHLFMMRCLVHLHNNDVNRQTLENLGKVSD